MTDTGNYSTTGGDLRTYWEQQQERERQEREARRAASPEGQNRARIQALANKLLDRAEAVLDRLPAAQQAPARTGDLSLTAARRQLAHIVRAPNICSRKACRRTKACCGEPKQCLAVFLPLLPRDRLEQLVLDGRKTRRGRAR